MSQELEQLKDKLIDGLMDQVNSYKELSTVNDSIIAKQKEYIAKLEEIVKQYKVLLDDSLNLLGKNIG